MDTINFQEECLKLVCKEISAESNLLFKEGWFTFYNDTCGQRGHYILPYKAYGRTIPNHYIIKRSLSFENEEDKGKQNAVLGILNLEKCKAISVSEDKIEFENFTIYLKNNSNSHKHKQFYGH